MEAPKTVGNSCSESHVRIWCASARVILASDARVWKPNFRSMASRWLCRRALQSSTYAVAAVSAHVCQLSKVSAAMTAWRRTCQWNSSANRWPNEE